MPGKVEFCNKGTTCVVDGCDGDAVCRHLCKFHYQRYKLGIELTKPRRKVRGKNATCEFPGCTEKHKAKGYCDHHYRRLQAEIPLDAKLMLLPPRPCLEAVGYFERKKQSGYWYVILPEKTNSGKQKIVLKGRFLYQRYFGVNLTPRDKVLFKDGNRENFAPDNLVLQPKTKRTVLCSICKDPQRPLVRSLYQLSRNSTATHSGECRKKLNSLIRAGILNARASDPETIIDIRIAHAIGCTLSAIAKRFDLCRETVSDIVHGNRFTDIPIFSGKKEHFNEFLVQAASYRSGIANAKQRNISLEDSANRERVIKRQRLSQMRVRRQAG